MAVMDKIILMYHGVISDGVPFVEGREDGAALYDVDLSSFKKQIDCLSDFTNQYELTFDDGEENNYHAAFSVLQSKGLKGRFFFIVNRVGTKGYCTWDQIREMYNAGMKIGSHGLTHSILTELGTDALVFELKESKRLLESNLDAVVDSISIPRGYYNKEVISLALECGYQNIYVSEKREVLKLNCFERVAVKKTWSLLRFKQALAGKKPFSEKVQTVIIRLCTACLGVEFYNRFRSFLLNIKKRK